MKKNLLTFLKYKVALLLLVVIAVSSCRSHKDLMYLRDVNGQESLKNLPDPPPVYKIKPKDNLYVSIISPNQELNEIYNPTQAGKNSSDNTQIDGLAGQFVNGYEVSSDGSITLPIIGKVSVQGKSIEESQKEVQTQAEPFIKQVTVKVRLLNFRVTVLGEVKNPGVYNNYNYRFTALEAIGMANGNTEFASLNSVLVLRPTPDGSQTYVLNLNTKSSLSSEGFYLQPNDVLLIQPSKAKNSQFSISTASLVLSAITSVLLLLNYVNK